MASSRFDFHCWQVGIMLIVAWYVLLMSIGIAILAGVRKN
jgi:hypothetical protein